MIIIERRLFSFWAARQPSQKQSKGAAARDAHVHRCRRTPSAHLRDRQKRAGRRQSARDAPPAVAFQFQLQHQLVRLRQLRDRRRHDDAGRRRPGRRGPFVRHGRGVGRPRPRQTQSAVQQHWQKGSWSVSFVLTAGFGVSGRDGMTASTNLQEQDNRQRLYWT